MRYRNTSVLLLPLVVLGEFIEVILKFALRLVATLVGFVLMVLGIILCVTIIGAAIGIPITVFGFMMMVGGFF